MHELLPYVKAVGEIGVPAVLVFLLIKSFLRTHESIMRVLLNDYGEKLDSISKVLGEIRDVLLEVTRYGRPFGQRKEESGSQGEEDRKA